MPRLKYPHEADKILPHKSNTSLALRVIYSGNKAARFPLVKAWETSEISRARLAEVRADLYSIGLGSAIPKRDNMRLSTAVAGTIDMLWPSSQYGHASIRTLLSHIVKHMPIARQRLSTASISAVILYMLPSSATSLRMRKLTDHVAAMIYDPALADPCLVTFAANSAKPFQNIPYIFLEAALISSEADVLSPACSPPESSRSKAQLSSSNAVGSTSTFQSPETKASVDNAIPCQSQLPSLHPHSTRQTVALGASGPSLISALLDAAPSEMSALSKRKRAERDDFSSSSEYKRKKFYDHDSHLSFASTSMGLDLLRCKSQSTVICLGLQAVHQKITANLLAREEKEVSDRLRFLLSGSPHTSVDTEDVFEVLDTLEATFALLDERARKAVSETQPPEDQSSSKMRELALILGVPDIPRALIDILTQISSMARSASPASSSTS